MSSTIGTSNPPRLSALSSIRRPQHAFSHSPKKVKSLRQHNADIHDPRPSSSSLNETTVSATISTLLDSKYSASYNIATTQTSSTPHFLRSSRSNSSVHYELAATRYTRMSLLSGRTSRSVIPVACPSTESSTIVQSATNQRSLRHQRTCVTRKDKLLNDGLVSSEEERIKSTAERRGKSFQNNIEETRDLRVSSAQGDDDKLVQKADIKSGVGSSIELNSILDRRGARSIRSDKPFNYAPVNGAMTCRATAEWSNAPRGHDPPPPSSG
ncbi:unnamed protein product [Protopolystoma xenopodis]|uniref:Uncharacterized protein n=1 Tax=Protopolystoma xenopodis TaxID=117903 RepID=A0A3S4ZQ97_9PLAT|nr:unnamed protein product [Protopolystoma xenopodis]